MEKMLVAGQDTIELLQIGDPTKKMVLVAEVQEANRVVAREILQKNYCVVEAKDSRQAIHLLEKYSSRISAIVLDLAMPDIDGYSIMKYLSMDERFKDIPVLMTTVATNTEDEKRCLDAGAWDFIPKPVNQDTLLLRLKNIIGRSQFDCREQKRSAEQYDQLTGLYNRSALFGQAKRLVEENPDRQYAFVRIDLNRFHLYNSFFGEEEGDKLLAYFAKWIKEGVAVFGESVFGRVEADIFGICCPYREKGIERLRCRLIRDLQEYNRDYYMEPSIGVYIIKDSNISAQQMYDRALVAAQSCKHKFMAEIGYYNDEMADRQRMEQELMNEAQKALDEGQFVAYLQPKMNLRTEEAHGAEVLVRWLHPEKGIVLPKEFIPVFEDNGFIGRLDCYMWEQACRLLRKWIDEGLDPEPLSVNVSRADMHDPNLIGTITELVSQYCIPKELFQLELTESAFVDNQDLVIEKVKSLQEGGFTVLMDDFGSGYSSLNTLKDIPVDILKIDMKFLGEGTGNSRSERILTSIVHMALCLDLAVIVEGVETKEQRNFLEGIGCEYIQGYYYAHPMPWQEYEDVLRSPKGMKHFSSKEEGHAMEGLWEGQVDFVKKFQMLRQPAAVYQYADGKITLLQGNDGYRCCFRHDIAVDGQFRNNLSYLSEKYVKKIDTAFKKCIQRKSTAHSEYICFPDHGKSKKYYMKLYYIGKEAKGEIVFVLFYEVSQAKEIEQEVKKCRKCLKNGKGMNS